MTLACFVYRLTGWRKFRARLLRQPWEWECSVTTSNTPWPWMEDDEPAEVFVPEAGQIPTSGTANVRASDAAFDFTLTGNPPYQLATDQDVLDRIDSAIERPFR